MRFLTASLFYLFFVSAFAAHAEYRVFLLKITTPSTNPQQTPPARFVASTLDPDQYPAYYPLHNGEKITYVDTWRCRGRTDFKELCPNPHAPPAPTQGLDSPVEPAK